MTAQYKQHRELLQQEAKQAREIHSLRQELYRAKLSEETAQDDMEMSKATSQLQKSYSVIALFSVLDITVAKSFCCLIFDTSLRNNMANWDFCNFLIRSK